MQTAVDRSISVQGHSHSLPVEPVSAEQKLPDGGPGLHPAKTPRFDGKPIRLRLATVALVDVKRTADLYAQGLTLRQMSFVAPASPCVAALPLIEIQLTSRPAPGV